MQTAEVIGRHEEKALLDEAVQSGNAELVTVYGRRRVGKTHLVRNHLKRFLVFEYSGIHNVATDTQLENFTAALSNQLNGVRHWLFRPIGLPPLISWQRC